MRADVRFCPTQKRLKLTNQAASPFSLIGRTMIGARGDSRQPPHDPLVAITMKHDVITAVGIDEEGRFYVQPSKTTFPYIYREAMEVLWNSSKGRLYSPPPREWTYSRWFQQIAAAAETQGWHLALDETSKFENVSPELEHGLRNLTTPDA